MSASDLDPDAPPFTPPSEILLLKLLQLSSPASSSGYISPILPITPPKEPQCSRYSRRSVRSEGQPNGPRPILGSKLPFPRPILGRKEEPKMDEADEHIGKEFRNMKRGFHKLKLLEELEEEEAAKNAKKQSSEELVKSSEKIEEES